MKFLSLALFVVVFQGCQNMSYLKTVDYININDFMGDWYVHAGRTTFLEKGAHNSLEQYSWNDEKKRIDIIFSMNKDSFHGEKRVIKQKAWIHNEITNAHWKVSPLWPLKLDYLVIAIDENKEWSVIGVPSQKWVWIMSRKKEMSESQLDSIINHIKNLGYSTQNIARIPQQWP